MGRNWEEKVFAFHDKYFGHEIWYLWFLSSDDYVEKPQTRDKSESEKGQQIGYHFDPFLG